MLLTIDVGNTLTDLGIFDGDELKSTFKIKSNTDRSYDEYRVLFSSYLREDTVMDASKKLTTGVDLQTVVNEIQTEAVKDSFWKTVTIEPNKTNLTE